jgi:hypothetical protein
MIKQCPAGVSEEEGGEKRKKLNRGKENEGGKKRKGKGLGIRD